LSSLNGKSFPLQPNHSTLYYWSMIFLLSILSSLITGAWSSTSAQSWQRDSESLVVGRMYEMEHPISGSWMLRYSNLSSELSYEESDDFTNRGNYLLQYGDPETTYQLYLGNTQEIPEVVTVYTSQSGLQGTVYGMISLVLKFFGLSGSVKLNILYLLNTTLLFALLLNLCNWLKDIIGIIPAFFIFFTALQSNWILISARNLYWVPWSFLLPLTVSIFIARKVHRGEGIHKWQYVVLMGSVVFRCMCGFEFVSFVLVIAELPFVYYFLEDTSNRKRWLSLAVKAGLLMVAGFLTALIIWAVQNILAVGSLSQALSIIVSVIAKRTGAFWGPDVSSHLSAPNAAYDTSLSASRFSVILSYLGPNIRLIGSFTVVRLFLLLGVALITAWTLAFLCKKTKQIEFGYNKLLSNIPFLVISFISFLGPISWYFLASGHSYIHHSICEILLFLPCVPMCVGEICYLFYECNKSLQCLLHYRRKEQ